LDEEKDTIHIFGYVLDIIEKQPIEKLITID
jgi:hypothetical protein